MARSWKHISAAAVAVVAGALALPAITGGAGKGPGAPVLTVDRAGVLQTQSVAAPARSTSPSVVSSDGLAGYLATHESMPLTSFDATVTLPTIACPAGGTFTSEISTQVDGNLSGGSFFELACRAGTADYTGIASASATGPTGPTGTKVKTVPVSPGDEVETAITFTTAASTTSEMVKVTDVTSGFTVKMKVSTTAGGDTYGWDILPSNLAVAPFGTIAWSGVKLNGGSLSATTLTKFVTVDNATDGPLVSVSTISGTKFTMTRQ